MGVKESAFDYIENITGGNMTLCIADQYILYYHIDACWSLMFRHSYFQSAVI